MKKIIIKNDIKPIKVNEVPYYTTDVTKSYTSWKDFDKAVPVVNKLPTKYTTSINYDLLKRLFIANESEVPSIIEKEIGDFYKLCIINKNNYHWYIGDEKLLLLSHMDIVHTNPPKESELLYNKDYSIVSSVSGLGADDRAGIYSIILIIKEMVRQGIKALPSLLFTYGEEAGCIGADQWVDDYINKKFPETYINFYSMVQIDRRNFNDVVCYDDDNKELSNLFINKLGFVANTGTCSDISIIAPNTGVSAVNISTAYFNEHTENEMLYIKELHYIIDRLCEFAIDIAPIIDKKIEYKDKPVVPTTHYYNNYYNNYYNKHKSNNDYKKWKSEYATYDDDIDDDNIDNTYIPTDDDMYNYYTILTANEQKKLRQYLVNQLDIGELYWCENCSMNDIDWFDIKDNRYICSECKSSIIETFNANEKEFIPINIYEDFYDYDKDIYGNQQVNKKGGA